MDNNAILYHFPSKRLYAIPGKDYKGLIRQEGTSNLSVVPGLKIECFKIGNAGDSITTIKDTLPAKDFKLVLLKDGLAFDTIF
jgi:hypothetical protein